MVRNRLHRLFFSFFALILLVSLPSYASAEIIDDITVHSDSNGDVEAVIKFSVPIQYLRHFPLGKSTSTSVYFNILGSVPVDQWQDYESTRTPPSDVIREITISTRDRGTGPKVHITFYRPAEFSVSMGRDNQTLLIHVKATAPQQQKENQTAPVPVVAAKPETAVPVVALPSMAKTSTPSTPTVALAATSTPTPTPVPAAVVAAPITSVAPSGDVTKPNVVLPQSKLKPVHIPLGGKDGLPQFPEIDQAVPLATVPPSEKPSLADQITKANNDAGALMANGGNALLTGQTFAAIDSFNRVLSLPPNKYTQDAQLWIGIAKERSGQLAKGILEFETYLKLYPDGKSAKWVKDRLVQLKLSQPALFTALNTPVPAPAKIQNTPYQYSEFGSLSMYYYQGASQTNTAVAAGAVQTPTSFSTTDQKSLMTNVNMTARSYNSEYDHRFVFQDFYAANFLPGQASSSRLGAAYYEMKDRIVDYSFKVGRQSGLGGGVMGRFDGISAGYGFTQNWRANVVAGQLSDFSLDAKPTFYGGSLDFGTRSPLGGSVYLINQTVSGIRDRQATGGNLRYFDQRFSIMSMVDYDLQFKQLNIFTVQGTLNGGGTANDYNFLIDRRRSPILDVRNAVNGTTATIASLQQNGFTLSDIVSLADQRTTTSTLAQIGMTNHLSQKWIIGTDFTVSKTAALAASGTLLPDGTQGVEGFVPAAPSTGNTWTLSERATGFGIIRPGDTTNFNVSYTKGQLTKAEAFQLSNHVDLVDKWTLDTTLHLGVQSDNTGGTSDDISPTARVTYRLRSNLSTDAQLGLDWSKTKSSVLQSSTTSHREFFSLGFQLLF